MSLQTKEFGAKIPKELYDEFRDLFPMYGATTWFIQTSLECFIKRVRDDHTLQQLVEDSVMDMLRERKISE